MTPRAVIVGFAAWLLFGCAAGGGPEPPFNVAATDVGLAALLTWDANGGDAFVIQRSDGSDYNYRGVAKVDGRRRSYTDVGLQSGQTYYYRIAAWYAANGGEMSAYCTPVSVTIQ